MWEKEEMDCLFIETAKNVKHRKHMYIECIAIPNEIGDMAPIYFKVFLSIKFQMFVYFHQSVTR